MAYSSVSQFCFNFLLDIHPYSQSYIYSLRYSLFLMLSVCICASVCEYRGCIWRSEATLWNLFSPSTFMWVSGIELRSSDSVAGLYILEEKKTSLSCVFQRKRLCDAVRLDGCHPAPSECSLPLFNLEQCMFFCKFLNH